MQNEHKQLKEYVISASGMIKNLKETDNLMFKNNIRSLIRDVEHLSICTNDYTIRQNSERLVLALRNSLI